ncbi:NUDIX hydrolase [Microlunatus speluncae]|uniref:NUDIX hydrolase n=1 Tax=Microlunatus speluncae TaxID=2594267 RepID=UPI001FEBBEE2|nr:NUDIX domain-containing protein [Microlunatus speluncae]
MTGSASAAVTGAAVQRFTVVPAAYLIFRRGEEVLLQYRSGTGYRDDHWAMAAAGHVEAGESVLAAGVREAAEELGLVVRESDLIPLCTLHRTNDDPADRRGTYEDERCDYFFVVTAWQGEPVIMEPEKAGDLRWFGLDRLPEPVVPHELMVLEALRDECAGGPRVPPIMLHGW